EERPIVERSENLLRDHAGILAIRKNFRGLERRRQIRRGKLRGGREIRADVLIGNEQSLLVSTAAGKTLLVIHDFGYDERGVGRSSHWNAARSNRLKSSLVKVAEPIVGCGLERRSFDDARGNEVE